MNIFFIKKKEENVCNLIKWMHQREGVTVGGTAITIVHI